MLPKILLGVGIVATVFSVLIFSGKIPGIGGGEVKITGSVILWGTLPMTRVNGIIQQFNLEAKTYRVDYVEVPEENFSQSLLVALANGTGPDLIMAPYQTILAENDRIYPFPIASLGDKQYKDTYVDGATIFFGRNGALALPVSIEPMVLFYNRTLFSKHGIVNPPEYWDEVTNIVPKLNILNNSGQFIESGIALGTPSTPYAKDILMAIVSQLGQIPVVSQMNSSGGVSLRVTANEAVTSGSTVYPLSSALRYYVQFADPSQKTYSWNQYLGDPVDKFLAEKLAMYIGYSSELAVLRARNPRAEIEMTHLPQTRNYTTFATGMKMYGIATLRSSRNPTAAFNVQAKFAGGGISPQIAANVGGVPALRAYAATPKLHTVIARGMLVARGWQDRFSEQSTRYTTSMISDVLNNRQGVSDASNAFVARMQDLYTPLK